MTGLRTWDRGFSRTAAAAAIAFAAAALCALLLVLNSGREEEPMTVPDRGNPPDSATPPGPDPNPDDSRPPDPNAGSTEDNPLPADTARLSSPGQKVLSAIVNAEDGSVPRTLKATLSGTGGVQAFSGWMRPSAVGKISIGAIPGTYALQIESFGYYTERVDVQETYFGSQPLKIVLKPDTRPCRVAVVVADMQGRAIAGGRVVLRLRPDGPVTDLDSDASGVRRADGLKAGKYGVILVPASVQVEAEIGNFEIAPGESRDCEFRIRVMALEGKVMDRDTKSPIAGAEVYLSCSRGKPRAGESPAAAATTGADGSFSAADLPSEHYDAAARAPGYGLAVARTNVNIEGGASVEILLRKSPGIALELSTQGEAVPQEIFFEGKGRNMSIPLLPVLKNEAGAFYLDLEPDMYNLRVWAGGFTPSKLKLGPEQFKSGMVQMVLLADTGK